MKLGTYSVTLALIACAVLLPFADSAYVMRLGTLAAMYAVLAVSWTIVGGFTGYPSFSTAAFFGLGAYAGGILVARGWSLPLAVACAALLAFALALALGSVLLRLKGHYFAIGSLAVVEVLRELANSSTDLTGGGMGLNVPMNAGDVTATASLFYWSMWSLLLLCFLLARWIEKSKLGFGLACIRQNEAAADMIGVNATLYKSLAFGFSAVAWAVLSAVKGREVAPLWFVLFPLAAGVGAAWMSISAGEYTNWPLLIAAAVGATFLGVTLAATAFRAGKPSVGVLFVFYTLGTNILPPLAAQPNQSAELQWAEQLTNSAVQLCFLLGALWLREHLTKLAVDTTADDKTGVPA